MSREKQIEAVYKVIMEAELGFPKANLPLLDIERYIAEAIYNADYRKQSEGEWISVEEKNPEDVYGKDREKITVLVCTKSGKVSASTRCARYSYDHKQNTWVRTGEFEWSGSKKVTHWMPMPNPYRGRDDQQEGMYI
jgi:hypothetical protein